MNRSARSVAPLLVTTALIAAQSLSAQAPPPPGRARAAGASDLPSPPGDAELGTFSEEVFRFVAGSPTAAADAEPPPTESAAPWAIEHVDVVPMHRPGVLRNRTVVVEDGVITEVGSADEVELAPDVEVVDGRGRWLLPGLVDTHVHLDDPDDLLLYLAKGVTTIVNLRGSPEHLAWREELARGERPGPRMSTCGPFLRGPDLEVEEIADRVREISRQGYDCAKIYDDWELEAYREVAAATREAEILFLGHAPREIGLEPVIEEGRRRIVHLEELVYATPTLDRWVESFDEEAGPSETDPGTALGEEVRRLAARLAEARIWVAATEVVIDTYLVRSTPEGLERLAERPSWRYLDPFRRRHWARADEEDHRRFVHQVALQHLLLEAFREAGVPMALGTDASSGSDLLVMPGWSVHEELKILVEAGGFSPYQALRQATVDAHRFLGRPGGGLVVEGAPADLLVLRENPLADIDHASEIETVAVRGERFPASELQSRLEERRERWNPLEQALAEVEGTFEREGKVAGARAHLGLVERHPAYAEEVEALVNGLGYELLFDDRIDEAIDVLGANAEAFPESANVWDSLAEAHLEKGDRDEAIRLYRRALDVDPDFSHAEEMLRELEEESGPE